jgi:pantothenate synthetase
MQQTAREEPRARVEYLVVRDALTLASPSPGCDHLVLLGAVRIGVVRLIDNILVRTREEADR